MLQEVIMRNYGIMMEQQGAFHERYEQFLAGPFLYTVVPVSEEIDEEELTERLKLSQFMKQQGDRQVGTFMLSREGTFLSENEGKLFILLESEPLAEMQHLNQPLGIQLAEFHEHGRSFAEPLNACSRIGKWKEMWETRLDTLESLWKDKLHSQPNNEFERLFVDSFPYFLSMGENAIQYLVDCEIDEQPAESDAGTICHERFFNETWRGAYLFKNPFDWVFDHPSRDIGEWMRQVSQQYPNTYQPAVVQFMREYQYYLPYSAFSWRLLYARLLFPVHYVETVENYYITGNQGEKKELFEFLQKVTQRTGLYEEFLRGFYELHGVPVTRLGIPAVDWL